MLRPARIALGAAYASLGSESVASFAEKCAFGLQKGNVVNQGTNDEHLDLEGSANTIWYKEVGRAPFAMILCCHLLMFVQQRGVVPVTVVATGDQAEYRIVCEPFLESYRGVLPTDRSMAHGASYDFLNIGTLPGGYKHRIEFTLNDKEQQVELKIYRMPTPLCTRRESYARRTARKEKVLRLGPFPVHVQPGTRSLVIQQSTDEIDSQIATAMEEYCDESVVEDDSGDENYRDDAERDGTYSDDSEGVDTDHDDFDGAIDYPDDVDNEAMPSGAQPGPSSGLGNSRHDPGPSSGSNYSHSQDCTSGGDDAAQDDDEAQGGDEAQDHDDDDEQRTSEKRLKNRSLSQRVRTDKYMINKRVKVAQKQVHQAQGKLERAKRSLEQVPHRLSTGLIAASNSAGNANETSAANAFTSTSRTSSSARGAIASKADTARATDNAFRGSRDVSGRSAPYSQTGFGVPGGALTSEFGGRPGLTTGPPRNNTVSSSGEASSSRHMGSSSMAAGYQGSASTTTKRPAPHEDDIRRPNKRAHTSGGTFSGAADSPRRNASRREPGIDRGTESSARQHSAASETHRDPLARRGGSDERPSADAARYSNLKAPSRRAIAAQEFTWSNRYRDQRHEAPVQPMEMLNLSHSVSASGTRSLDPMPPPPRHDDNAPPRASPACHFGSGPRLLDSWRPASGPLSRRTSGLAGNSQQHQGFNGWDRANRGGYPPRSD